MCEAYRNVKLAAGAADSSIETCLPKVGEPARTPRATSRSRPRTTLTSLSWAAGGTWKCSPRSVTARLELSELADAPRGLVRASIGFRLRAADLWAAPTVDQCGVMWIEDGVVSKTTSMISTRKAKKPLSTIELSPNCADYQ
jgi:hypothetical protein